MKYLIINADDFGISKKFNETILDLLKNEKIKSTTIMVNRITKEQEEQITSLKIIRKKQSISVGLHIEFENNNYQKQIKDQYKLFLDIFNSEPSHIDVHKALKYKESNKIIAIFCEEKQLPCRNIEEKIEYFKTTNKPCFFGTTEKFTKIEKWIKTLEEEKYYEILFHPGIYDSKCVSSLNKKRELDTKHILQLQSILQKYDIKQINYLDLAKK